MGGELLDPHRRSDEALEFETSLRQKVIGQNEAVQTLVDLYQVFCAKFHPVGRPIANLLFLGPTGSGKTRLVEAMAEVMLGTAKAVLKINCAEFQHSHEIAKLIGSPPGYLGHRDTQPLITQSKLAAHYNENFKISFLLFDEIEKASDALWQLLLGMMDKASLTLGDNSEIDLSQTVIFMTSNLGGSEITELLTGGLGFVQPKNTSVESLDGKVTRTAEESARRKFSPEFMNRVDKMVVFHPLRPPQLEQIVELELGVVQERILDHSAVRFLLRVAPEARAFLLRDGTNLEYGARHLKRTIEKHIVSPLAHLVATHQAREGDVVLIDWDEAHNTLTFTRDCEGAIIPDTEKGAEPRRDQMPNDSSPGEGASIPKPHKNKTFSAVSGDSLTGFVAGTTHGGCLVS